MEHVPSTQPATQLACPFCSASVDGTAFFCPTCGKNIKEKIVSTGFWAQFSLYVVSILLPPLFLGVTIKYLKSKDPLAKQIGLISLGLTIIALIGAIWLSIAFTKSITWQINQQINRQINQYQDLGL